MGHWAPALIEPADRYIVSGVSGSANGDATTAQPNNGHTAGDVVRKEAANRLSGHAGEESTVCRNGGDEFLHLLVNPQGHENTERIVRSIVQRISKPISVGGDQLVVRASIGIAVYPGSARTPEELIAQADAAMYEAKPSRTDYAFAEVFGSEQAAA